MEKFRDEGIHVTSGPTILRCKGSCGGSSHKYVSIVQHHQCRQCKQVVCWLWSAKVGDDEHCLSCYLLQHVLPEAESGVWVDTSRSASSVRTDLKDKYHFDHANDLSITEVEDVWEAYAISPPSPKTSDVSSQNII